ncbi:hypothetical protein F4677DRAFT_62327 [Hypoxylon crocopeplum]|nr:hypothetical protein F4677DRAFT_62327 [Hypoxylon crocopeplum]
MAEAEFTSIRSPTLEVLQNRSRDMRRVRPPDITVLRSENRVPLRPERLAKRESKIGLRNIFSKSKASKDNRAAEETSSLREVPRHGGIRTSLADIGTWPQRLQPSRSEVSLLSSPPASLRSPVSEASFRSRQSSNSVSKGKLRQPADAKPRAASTTFVPPPLFQMYPQAVKHATLPACITPIDVLVRFSESKSGLQQSAFSRSDLTLDQGEAARLDRRSEAEKKKKAKFAPEWTSKVYALVTSGYLLQYAAEGRFDRLPEKILQLTRNSAAYASDLIPGRHWVVRVTSSTDADGNPSTDTKSFRSKLALRGIEKRQVTNMLLVFESPETMDTWLAILRREIESLGGKKKLSETGKAEADDGDITPKAQASQRTLVTRDPGRFSRIVSQDFSWTQENAFVDPTEDNEFIEPPIERMSESTVDDGSSMLSSDGLRLDSLRDSGSGSGSSGSSGNRLSFISSGQRTILSSAESSPTHSPIRESFSSHGDDFSKQIGQPILPPMPEVRLRPNAAAIVNRRQSMQTMIPGFDPRLDVTSRSLSTTPTPQASGHENRHQFVPNFSVPHTVGRRYSAMGLSALATGVDQPQTLDRDVPVRPLRRSPPTTLAISRPLSIVLDQPSPRSPCPPAVPAKRSPTLEAPDSASMFGPWDGSTPKSRPQRRMEVPHRLISDHIMEPQLNNYSMSTEYQHDNVRAGQRDSAYQGLEKDMSRTIQPVRTRSMESRMAPEQMRRAASSLEMRRASTAPVLKYPSYKRTASAAENPSLQNRHSFMFPKQSTLPSIEEPSSYTLTPPLTCSPKRSAPSLKALQEEASPPQFLAVDMGAKALLTRRSMPHLVEGPPPAPPPTCALPPIPMPRKRSSNAARSVLA